MKVSEILHIEKDNKDSIILHKEGLFWRAYESSAYLLHTHYRQFRLTKKQVKYLNKEMVYCGFPDGSLDSLINHFNDKEIKRDNKQIVIDGFGFSETDFETWRENIDSIAPEKTDGNSESTIEKGHYVIDKIMKFPVVHKSPLECQQFVIEIQKEINGTLH